MKNLLFKPIHFHRIEFWGVATIFVFAVFFFITNGLENDIRNVYTPNRSMFEEAGVNFYYYKNYFVPSLIRYAYVFSVFLLLNFYVVPKLIERENITWNIVLIVLLFILSGIVLGATDTYLKAYLLPQYPTVKDAQIRIYQSSFLYAAWLLLVFLFYTVVKYAGQYLLYNTESIQAKYKIITKESLVALVVWMISMFLFVASNAPGDVVLGWGITIPFSILFYGYSIRILLPKAIAKRRPFLSYLGKALVALVITFFPICFLILLFIGSDDEVFAFSFFNIAVQLFVTVPLSWIVFRRMMRGNEELISLRRELGASTASFDFLRSQINPHFLFNALNTIYGTALQESADRTAEGVQRLGDMMRFMLQENMQDKIPLSREVEYLSNYINLQKLRTDTTPSISITSEIENPVLPVQIAPMLLIPFVENAFKHGISFREPSHIKVTLELKGNTLNFDVYNSKHAKVDHDPERDKSGIGLANVRQRLQLLYPSKHDLQIRETGKEFFVHLTLQLV